MQLLSIPDSIMDDLRPLNSAAQAIIGIAGLSISVYLAGLLVHGLQRYFSGFLWSWLPSSVSDPVDASGDGQISWYQHLSESNREELSLYFWYTRATCRNLAVTGFLLALPAIIVRNQQMFFGAIGLAGIMAALSADYATALTKSVMPAPDQDANGPKTSCQHSAETVSTIFVCRETTNS